MTTKSDARAQAALDAMIKAAEAHKALVAIPVTPEQKRALVAYAEARYEAIKLANPGRTDGMSESAWFAAERAFRLWRAGPHNFNAPSAANDER